MKKNVLVFGLISGLVVSTLMAISMVTMYNNPDAGHGGGSMIIGYLSMLVAFSLIFVAVKNYRDKQNGGVISFGKAFKIGLLIALIGSTMYVIMWALLYNFYMPDFMDRYCAQMIENAKAVIENEKKAALTEVKNQVAQLTLEVTDKLLRKNLSSQAAQQELVEDMVKDINLN